MQLNKRWMVVGLVIGSLQLSACGSAPSVGASKPNPAEVSAIDGTDLKRVQLDGKAARRLDIQTADIRDEQVTRKRTVGGQVEILAADPRKVRVRVPISEADLKKVDHTQTAMILPLVNTPEATGVTAKPVQMTAGTDSKDAAPALYYALDSAQHKLISGQRVRVELSLAGSGTQRSVVPYSAVIYDLDGTTWVYTSPEPLVFVRAPITVDYIDGDLAVLSKGPAAGTKIVVAGAAELYGVETGVSH